MFRGLEQYKAGASFARDVVQILQPVRGYLEQNNLPPQQFLHSLTAWHSYMSNPQLPAEQKRELAIQALRQYGVDLGQPQAPEEEGYVDPQVKTLRETVARLESQLNGFTAAQTNAERQRAQQALASVTDEVTKFAADPAHPYFDKVADDVATLIQASGGQLSLKDAYERAVWANPETRALETARVQSEAVEKARKEAEERATAARQTQGARVKSSGHQGTDTGASGSMEDTMEQTMAEIRARQKRG